MTRSSRPGTTQLLVDLREGDSDARPDLCERVSTELQRRAQEQDGTTDSAALADAAYRDLIDPAEQSQASRSHFFSVAGSALRRILVNRARRIRSQAPADEAPSRSLNDLRAAVDQNEDASSARARLLVVLDEALDRLADHHTRPARIAECQLFADMSIPETAEALGVSALTVRRDWDAAQAWLYREMQTIWEAATNDD